MNPKAADPVIDYKWNAKTRSAYASGTGVISQLIDIHDNVAEANLARMNSDDERFALFDGVTQTLSLRIGKWFDLYNAIRVLEKHPEYWKARKYKSFEAFLADKLGTSLAQWKELEELYHYAATACPDLFNISGADVAKLRKAIEEIEPAKIGRPAKTDLAGTMAEAAAYKIHGPNTLPRVIGTLKRLGRLDIIEKALKEADQGVVGNFVKEDRLGNKSWSVAAFQKAARMKTSNDRNKQTKRSDRNVRQPEFLEEAAHPDDTATPADQWAWSVSVMLGNLCAAEAFWDRNYPGWHKLKPPAEVRALMRQARAASDKFFQRYKID